MNGNLSVNEVLMELFRVYLVTMETRRVSSKVTKKAGDVEKVMGMKLFSKILGELEFLIYHVVLVLAG